jgi:hypothetical protein
MQKHLTGHLLLSSELRPMLFSLGLGDAFSCLRINPQTLDVLGGRRNRRVGVLDGAVCGIRVQSCRQLRFQFKQDRIKFNV